MHRTYIKQIKYNRTIGELNKVLDYTITADAFHKYKPFYNLKYIGTNPMYYIDDNILFVNYYMFVEKDLTFGLDERLITDLIREKHNIKTNRVIVLIDLYGKYIEFEYDWRN